MATISDDVVDDNILLHTMPELQRSSTSSPGPSGSSSTSGPPMLFTGHHHYIVTVAKMCRETQKYTDVDIKCEDGTLQAHR